MTLSNPSLKPHHLRVMQASLHVVNHHADASVNSWLLETNDKVIILIIAVLSIPSQETKIYSRILFLLLLGCLRPVGSQGTNTIYD
jgi:hypothetical protein